MYRARDLNLDRNVALKVLDAKWADDPQFRERFLREARLAASISHSGVVTLHDVGEESGQLYMAMEYVASSLQALIEKRGPLPIDETLRIIREVANGLDAAHEKRIVHRDIKPANILLTETLSVKVSDFGIARAAAIATMTSTGVIMGTPLYMSPEQARGDRADIRSDIYALGVVFYQVLTGKLPFNADTPLALLRQHIDVAPPRVRQTRVEVSPSVDAIVDRCLAKDPAHRYKTPAELAQALARTIPGAMKAAPVEAGAVTPSANPPRPISKDELSLAWSRLVEDIKARSHRLAASWNGSGGWNGLVENVKIQGKRLAVALDTLRQRLKAEIDNAAPAVDRAIQRFKVLSAMRSRIQSLAREVVRIAKRFR